MPVDLKSDCDKVLAALHGAVRLSRTDISYNVFGRHRTLAQLDAIGEALETDGSILRLRADAPGGNERRPTEVWEIIISQNRVSTNGSHPAPRAEGPPAGEGWLPKAKTLRRAQRGIVPAVAARHGRQLRKAAARKQTAKRGVPRVSDEARGAADYIGNAYRGYLEQGVIEVEGDWIRLVKNPNARARLGRAALLHFLAEAHPTLDGKWHRKPKKTLVGVMEDALGRKLEAWEVVRRRPGSPGSWNPDVIVLHDYEHNTMRTLAEVRSFATASPLQ